MRRVLLTGGAGFVGASLALGLAAKLPGYGMDDLPRDIHDANVERWTATTSTS